MKTITIEIQPGGEVKIETKGFAGPDCEKATKFLEEALGGGDPTGKGRTSDYYVTQQQLGQQRT